MVLSYLQILALTFIAFTLGSIITYALMKRRIKSLKDALSSMDASLRGMWSSNEKLQRQKQLNKQNVEAMNSIIAKHASDPQPEPTEFISKEI